MGKWIHVEEGEGSIWEIVVLVSRKRHKKGKEESTFTVNSSSM